MVSAKPSCFAASLHSSIEVMYCAHFKCFRSSNRSGAVGDAVIMAVVGDIVGNNELNSDSLVGAIVGTRGANVGAAVHLPHVTGHTTMSLP